MWRQVLHLGHGSRRFVRNLSRLGSFLPAPAFVDAEYSRYSKETERGFVKIKTRNSGHFYLSWRESSHPDFVSADVKEYLVLTNRIWNEKGESRRSQIYVHDQERFFKILFELLESFDTEVWVRKPYPTLPCPVVPGRIITFETHELPGQDLRYLNIVQENRDPQNTGFQMKHFPVTAKHKTVVYIPKNLSGLLLQDLKRMHRKDDSFL